MSVKPGKSAPLLPPGTYLEEWLEDQHGMTQQELAARLVVSPKHLSRVINGHVPVSPDFAAKLAVVTGYSAEFWLEHQARYDARTHQLKITDEDIVRVKSLLPDKVISRLREAKIVTHNWHSPVDLVREIYMRAHVAGSTALEHVLTQNAAIAYCQGAIHTVHPGHQWAWLEIVKDKAQSAANVPAFDRELLDSSVPTLRAMTREDPEAYIEEVGHVLKQAGVIFVAEPDIPGARISGASFDLFGTPVIAVTDKHMREDIFWLTLFHEIAHVLGGDHLTGSMNIETDDDIQPHMEINTDTWKERPTQKIQGLNNELPLFLQTAKSRNTAMRF